MFVDTATWLAAVGVGLGVSGESVPCGAGRARKERWKPSPSSQEAAADVTAQETNIRRSCIRSALGSSCCMEAQEEHRHHMAAASDYLTSWSTSHLTNVT